jgi:NitT/TauT family transport system substrate-binding protein
MFYQHNSVVRSAVLLMKIAGEQFFSTLVLCLILSGAAWPNEPFRLVVTDAVPLLVPNSVMELALELGYFRRENVEVKLVRVEQTPLAVAALLSGQGDMANISVEALLHLAGRGERQWKAVVSPNKSFPFLIVGRREVASAADLPGRTFGVGRVGSLDHSLTSAVLRAKEVDPSAVSFISIGQPQLRAQALAIGRIDATTVSIGTWLGLAKRPDLHVLLTESDYFAAAPVVSKVNVVAATTIATKRDQIRAVVSAIIKASRDFAQNPSEWAAAMEKMRPDVSREELETLAQMFRSSWSVNGGLNIRELQFTADWLYTAPDLKDLRRLTPKDWVDFSFVDSVLATSGVVSAADPPAR